MAESAQRETSEVPQFCSEWLSPSELFAARSRCHRIPARGQKDFLPDGSAQQRERLERSLEEHWSLVSEERVERLGALVQAEWIPSKRVVELRTPAGKFWQTMGFSEHGKQFLLPEEALYLMECGSVQVFLHGLPLSIQEGYEMFLSPSTVTLQQYEVFSHLKRLGYIVTRFEPSCVLSHYERTLNLPVQRDRQGRALKRKRSHSPHSERPADEQEGEESTEPPDHEAKNQRFDPENHPDSLTEEKDQGEVEDKPVAMESTSDAVLARNWWVDRSPRSPMSPTRSQAPRWDFFTITFPDLGAWGPLSPLVAPDPTVLPGELSVSECELTPWLQRLNLRKERLSRREQEREQARRRYQRSVNDDKEVRRCGNWAEYQELLRRRRRHHGQRDRPPHLWESTVKPLVQPGQHTSPGTTQVLEEGADEWKISFDVFQPDTVAEFKKSKPGKPYSRLCVCSFEGPVPDLRVLKQLAFQSGDIPVTFAVVDHGDISFYCFKDFQLPTDVSH
ncbi:tRNA-splicing endonuclease subunit Sen54-like [Scleropages formosus]|uniref:tRNA-splicing endonuclease subunit Sen54-like n=1 Tax=Scleropages formosus TaxID=113540 RepID=A0A0P7XMZ0_SCLFO|nr:tRNA-splicing endonuclease subunit Sen54-like [Scleropages formosus]